NSIFSATDSNIAAGGSPGIGFPPVNPISGDQISLWAGGETAYSISGTITGGPLSTVTYSGPTSGTVTADGSGNYTIPTAFPGTYLITPTLFGYTMSPLSSSQTVTNANITGVNFTATSNVKSGGGGVQGFRNFVNKKAAFSRARPGKSGR